MIRLQALRAMMLAVSAFSAPLILAQGAITMTVDEDRFVTMVLESDPTLSKNAAALEAKAGAWLLELRAYFPRLTFEYADNERIYTGAADSFTKRLSLSVEQFLWDGGRSLQARDNEAAWIALEREGMRRARLDVAESARSAYRDYLALRMKLDIARSAVKAGRYQLEIARLEFELGSVREIDVLELETKVLELEISEAELVMKLSDTEYALHKAMAGPPGTRIIFSGTINATERGIELSENTDAWGALAVDRSPECMEARLEFEQVRAEVENASSAWIPSLGLSGTASMEGTRFPLDNFSWSVGLSISFTEPGLPTKGSISMGGAVNERNASWSTSTEPAANISAYASIQARSLALLQARERIATAQADAMRNLESLCARYRASSRARDVCARRRDAAVKKRVLSRLLLDAGRITRSDFMKVEEDLSRAETGLVDAALALVQAQRALERVLDIPPGDLGVFIKANEVRK